jgi:hypothetical protein
MLQTPGFNYNPTQVGDIPRVSTIGIIGEGINKTDIFFR